MVDFTKVVLILSMLQATIISAKEKDEEKHVKGFRAKDVHKINTNLGGSFGYFYQNFSEYPTKNSDGIGIIRKHILEYLSIPKDDVIRLLTIETRPYLFVRRDRTGFSISGPLYSIAKEAADLINYTITAINIQFEERHAAFVIFKPDFVIALVWPQLEYVRLTFLEEDPFGLKMLGIDRIGWFTKSLGVVEVDYILYYSIKPSKRPLFSFVSVFDVELWILIFILAFSILLTTSIKPLSKFCIKEYFRHLFVWNFVILNSMLTFSTDIRKYRKKLILAQSSLFLLWMTFCYFLQSLFGGDMFAQLALEPKPIVIDSLSDLRKDTIKIQAVDVEMIGESRSDSKTTFSSTKSFYKELANRIEYLPLEVTFDMKLRIETSWGKRGDKPRYGTCSLNPKMVLNYIKNTFDNGRFREILHVSKEGGEAQMHVFPRVRTADEKESFAMDYV